MATTEDIGGMDTKRKSAIKKEERSHGMSVGVSFAMAASGSFVVYSLSQNFAASVAIGVGATTLVYCAGKALQKLKII